MTEKDYAIASTEVLEVLKHFRKEDLEKIPKKFINFLESNKLIEYQMNFDFSKPITELPLKKESKALLGLIYKTYWCTEEEKKEYDEIIMRNSKRNEEILKEKYNPDNIFKKENIITYETEEIKIDSESKSLLDYSKLKWYDTIIRKIKVFVKNILGVKKDE